ncbi:MAG: alpha/beta hydrolase [Pseudomonadota bacterium]
MRQPFELSASDATVLRGWRYDRARSSSGRGGNRAGATLNPHTLLCIPSELGNSREYDGFAEQVMALPNGPRRLYLVDLRGRGRSDAGPGDDTTETDTADIVSLIDGLGLHDVDILVSGRATTALFPVAKARPGTIRRLVLNDAAPEFDPVGIARFTALEQRASPPATLADAAAYLQATRGNAFPALSDEDWAAWAGAMYRQDGPRVVPDRDPQLVRYGNMGNFEERQPLLWQDFKLFRRCPTLLLRGAGSEFLSADISERMEREHGNLRQVTIPGQGHPLRLHLNGLAEAIAAFLALEHVEPTA